MDTVCEAAEPADDYGTIEADAQPVITLIIIRTVENSGSDSETDTATE